MNERQKELWLSLYLVWQAYKRTAAWTPTQQQRQTVESLSFELLGKHLKGCASCYIDAMRQLERMADE